MLKIADRVFETSTTQGTGTINLDGPVTAFRSFAAAFSTSDKIPYIMEDNLDWEIGVGTLTEGSPDQLSRDTVYASSNAGELVNWGSGTRNIRVGPVADLIFNRTENKNVVIGKGTATGDGTTHNITMDVAPLAYEAGMEISYECPADVTGAVNINVDGLGEKDLLRNGDELEAGDLLDGDTVRLYYNGTHFESLLPVRLSDVPVKDDETLADEDTDKAPSERATKVYVDNTKPLFIPVFHPWSTKATNEVWVNGQTIGDVGSGADLEDAEFEILFDKIVAEGATYGNTGSEVFGSGDTVKLPDYRGVVIAGADNMGGTTSRNLLTGQPGGVNGDTLGAVGGQEETTPTEAKTASHDHTFPLHGAESGGNNDVAAVGDSNAGSAGFETTNDAGSNQATNNIQPTLIQNFVMRYK